MSMLDRHLTPAMVVEKHIHSSDKISVSWLQRKYGLSAEKAQKVFDLINRLRLECSVTS